MGPLVLELKRRKMFDIVVCVTGQHREMLDQVLDIFNIIPDHDLNIMIPGQTLFDININILSGLRKVIEAEKPNLILVHGDTSTAYATALTAFYLHIPVGHVEAGLRTFNLQAPFPEEFNRQAISIIAEYHFSPTEIAKQNLIKENINQNQIFVTGNTAIDALKITVNNNYKSAITDWIGNSRMILLTAHRRENLGEPLRNIFRAVKKVLAEFNDTKVIYPIHLNPQIRELANEVFGSHERLKIVEPMDVIDFHNIMNRSHLILTDSGGIQEEAPSLGKPVIVLRDTTERPEGIEAGTLLLAGTSEISIYDKCKLLLSNQELYSTMKNAVNPYGDGTASVKICDILEERL
jgi:UDP-N-acetylglucosamine 2-epimerase (non-hydrolysing)